MSENEAWEVIGKSLDSLPVGPLRDSAAAALVSLEDSGIRRVRILNLVQEALAQLRLDTKYMAFDLEATRRERDQYKSQIDG